ncbi:MAG: PepSY domain-containing protein [Proteobacteria bacterium]|nr:PepSY domain-containing protein [Pseudomonadota bacterium]MBS0574527.1 PepSY domain-containing protein [Pseudomonadota bacterium]
MFRALALVAAAVLIAGPALAGSTAVTCSKSPASKFQPQSALESKLKASGLKVKKIKTENGCYEAYTVDANGKKGTFGFNAETLEPVANAEAGEG